MADSNEIEIAPVGTRALLGEVAKALRGYEAHHHGRAEETRDALAAGVDPATVRPYEASIEKADRNARLAGKVEALLLGWEAE